MNVYMDDARIGIYNSNVYACPEWKDWVIVRSVENVKVLLESGMVDQLSLDHDMGYGLPTGKDLVNWMCDNNCFPKGDIIIHSANPVGAENMRSLLRQYVRVHKLNTKVF